MDSEPPSVETARALDHSSLELHLAIRHDDLEVDLVAAESLLDGRFLFCEGALQLLGRESPRILARRDQCVPITLEKVLAAAIFWRAGSCRCSRSRDTDPPLTVSQIGLEDVALVSSRLNLAKDIVPLPLESLEAPVQGIELEALSRVRDPHIGPPDHGLLNLGASLGRLRRSGSEKILLVVELELVQLHFKKPQRIVGRRRFHRDCNRKAPPVS